MKLLPPVYSFTFATKKAVPKEELRRYMFWYKMDYQTPLRHLLGSFIGNPIYDEDFAKKLNHIRGLLSYKGIRWEESSYIIYEEELRASRRLDAEQRLQRKLSKLINAYNKAKENIANSTELFKDELYRKLEEDYKKEYDKAMNSYNPDKILMPNSDKI